MLVGSVSSMISIVYRWELTSSAGGIVTVAPPSEAGTFATHGVVSIGWLVLGVLCRLLQERRQRELRTG